MRPFNSSVRISIVVPIYNVKEYLSDCLESILRLTELVNAEVILIDDESTDGSSEIAKEYSASYSAFRYYHKKNGGAGDARNYGVDRAAGDYLLFVDPDDIINPDTYEEMLRIADHSNSDITICKYVRVKNETIILSGQCKRIFSGIIENRSHIREQSGLVNDVTVWNKLIRRDFWLREKIRFPINRNYEDIPTMMRAHYYANNVSICWKTGYLWRIRTEGGLSSTQNTDDHGAINDYFQMISDVLSLFIDQNNEARMGDAFLHKVFRYDINMFLNRFFAYDDEKIAAIVRWIDDLFLRYDVERLLPSFPAIYTTIYKDILSGKFDHLNRVINFRNTSYANMPFLYEEGEDVKVRLPEMIIDEPLQPAKLEVRGTFPTCQIRRVFLVKNRLVVQGTLFQPKIQVDHNYPQRCDLILIDSLSDYRQIVRAKEIESPELSRNHGGIICHEDYRRYYYNYDMCGFRGEIDLEELDRGDGPRGDCVLLIRYCNVLNEGIQPLDGASELMMKNASKVSYHGKQSTIRVQFDKSGALYLRIEKKEELNSSGNGKGFKRIIGRLQK